MKHTHLLLLTTLLAAILSGWCGPRQKDGSVLPSFVKQGAPERLKVVTEKEVTFYPTYSYKDAQGWNINLRGLVHKDQPLANHALAAFSKCNEGEETTFRARSGDLLDDAKTFEEVFIKFDSDPEDKPYKSPRSKSDGIVNLKLVLSDEQATRLLDQQNSSNGWLTYRAVSREHTGLGRVRLIQPDPNGISLVSDIDDTIKITQVPAGRDIVLRNTFCLDFKPVLEPDMAARYKELGDIPIHYVSGGPEQLFGPLYDYLIAGDGRFPEGTVHLKFFPTTAFSLETSRNLIEFIRSSLEVTYDHKLDTIETLMDKYPDRKFILVGDSGEIDPEVYNEVRKRRPAQVKEIWIRDVINDNVVNPFRLIGMTVIPVNPPVCMDDKHFDHLTKKFKKTYPNKTYQRNTTPPCGQ
ncbi:MAG: phosphatase domain-containing protein [Acidobacteriota bacterium]